MKKTFRILSILAIIVGAALLVETGFRMFEQANIDKLFIPTRRNSQFLEINKNFSGARIEAPDSGKNWIKKNKSKHTIRIFVLKPASKINYPVNPNNDFSHLLKYYLQRQYPEQNLELVSIPLISPSGYAEYEIAKQLPQYQPDLVILFPGLDEYTGDGTIGSGNITKGKPSLYRICQNSAIYRSFFSKNKTAIISAEVNPKLQQKALQLFETNLEDIAQILRNANIPALMVNTSSNILDQPPADSFELGDNDSILKKQFEEGKQAYSEGDFDKAYLHFYNLYKKDKNNASVCFYLGKLALKDNNIPLAEQYLQKAIEMDPNRSRPSSEINRIIYKVAVTKGCSLIEPDQSLREFIKGIPGNNLFHGKTEKRLLANALTARECYKKIMDEKLIRIKEPANPSTERMLPITPFDSAYDNFVANKLENKIDYTLLDFWPSETGCLETFEEHMATLFLLKKKSWEESMNNLYEYYLRNKNYQLAFKVIENMALENPYDNKILEMASDTASYTGNAQMVVYYAQKAFNLKPKYSTAKLLFLNYLKLDNPEKALPYLTFAWNRPKPIDNLGLILTATKRVIALKRSLLTHPEDRKLKKMINTEYLAMGNTEAASRYTDQETKD